MDKKNSHIMIIHENINLFRYYHKLFDSIIGIRYDEFDYLTDDIVLPKIIILIWDTKASKLLNRLKNNNIFRYIPVVLIINNDEEISMIKGYDLGVDLCLQHPISQNLFSTIIKNFSQKSILYHQNPKNERENLLLLKLNTYIEKNIDKDLSINNLGRELGLSRTNLYRKIKNLTGQKPSIYIRNFRLNKAIELICEGKYTIDEISESIGFNSHSYFTACFKKEFHISPQKWQHKITNR